MEADDIEVTFGPAAGDRNMLPKAALATLDAIYRHPLSHNLGWSDVVTLFEKLGVVGKKPHNEMAFKIGGENHLVRKPHGKDLTASEVMDFRHLLTRHGWSPHKPSATVDNAIAVRDMADRTEDILVVVEHHEARLYHLEIQATDSAEDVIRPYDPHHLPHHLAHRGSPASVARGRPKIRGSTNVLRKWLHLAAASSSSGMARDTATLRIT